MHENSVSYADALSAFNKGVSTYKDDLIKFDEDPQQPDYNTETVQHNQQDIVNNKNPELEENFAKYSMRNIVKPAIKGFAGIADIVPALINLGTSGINYLTGGNIPQSKYPTDYLGDVIDKLSGISKGESNAIGKGIEFAISMLSGGGIGKAIAKQGAKKLTAKAAKRLAKTTKVLGSTNPLVLGVQVLLVLQQKL